MTTWNNAVWIMSDLQLRTKMEAQAVLGQAISDMRSLGLPLDGIWCLGDVLQGSDLASLEETAQEIIALLEPLQLPICFTMGNHDMDLQRRKICRFPVWEAVHERAGWHTNAKLSDLCFTVDWAGYRVFFLGDHASGDGAWFTSGGGLVDENGLYPHLKSTYASLRNAIAACGKPVVLASHYAMPGGPRWSRLQSQLMPLPINVRTTIFGHAHVGDPVWNPDTTWQRRFTVQDQEIAQFNISAMESKRSPGSHSAVLFADVNGNLELRVRCHLQREWVDLFPLMTTRQIESEVPRMHV